MRYLKEHWFGILSGAVVFVFLCLFVLVLISPREDAKGRGFIPCTQAMAENLLTCEEGSKISCLIRAVAQNTYCDLSVVGRGFKDWVGRRQAAPWSNYIFVPEVPRNSTFDEAEQAEYLKNNPTPAVEMKELIKLHKELENEISYEEVDENEKPK